MKKALLILIAIMTLACAGECAIDKKAEIASLRDKLSGITSRSDSIEILYDIFDLSDRKDYMQICRELDGVAARQGNNAVRYDMARQMANVSSKDSVLALIENHVRTLPKGKEYEETLLFVKLRRLSATARYLSEKERQERVAHIIVPEDFNKLDKYAAIERLFTICEYLTNFAEGDLLAGYLDELGEMIQEYGFDDHALMNIYYTECANIYSYTDQHQKAVDADRKLLKIIDNLEKKYKAQGRKYRNYDVSRFVVYRRMLSNYKVLSLEEVNDLYGKVLELAQNNEEVRNSMDRNKRSSAYHAMKNERYAEAIPYIRRQISTGGSQRLMKRMYEMLKEAAEKSGDKSNYDLADRELTNMLSDLNSEEAREKYNELKIRYDVSTLRAENAELELENQKEQIESSRKLMMFVIIGWIVVAIMLFGMLYYWTRYRKMVSGLQRFVDSLETERDAIKTRRYYDYTRKETSGITSATYSSPHPKAGNLQEMIDYVINDVMFISSVAFDDARKYRHTISVDDFMKNEVAGLEKELKKNVTINAVYPQPDIEMRVDEDCLSKLCGHILRVAAHLTPEGGSVGFECTEDKATGMARFVFKHSGKSLPVGREERIFENFFNYEELSQDGEAALTICRMIDFLTGSILKSSAGHTQGGKLVLMVPLS